MTDKEKEDLRKRSTDLFNNLPYEVRGIVTPSSICTQINELEIQKLKLKNEYTSKVNLLNSRIKSMYHDIKRELKELEINET